MPQMTLNRNYTLRTRLGHCITFKRGKPTHVPPMVVKQAIEIGAQPLDQSILDEIEKADEPMRRDEAQNPELREKRIREELTAMRARNLREYFTASGTPSLKHLSMLVGFEVDKHERDRIWHELLTEERERAQDDAQAAV